MASGSATALVTAKPRRLLTIGHSYCVTLNRRLADEIGRRGDWDVTAVGPTRFPGDFAWHTLQSEPDEACAVVPVPVHCARRVLVMLYGRRLRALLNQPWDLVHCWEEPYVAAAAQVAAWTPRGTPLVFATFQNIVRSYPPPFSWIERYAMARADGVVAFGHTVIDTLRRRGFARVPARVIPPGVDASHFAPDLDARAAVRRELGWPADVPVVGFLGRLVREKGIGLLTGVLDQLTAPWRALFVGSGPLESELQAWIGRHPGQAVLQPAVGHDQVVRYLNAMDLLAAPSQTTGRWREQFGRMLIEAFACGVPVVASDSGEIPYVVGDAGLVVGERDADGWRDALGGLLTDPARRRDLGRRGRRRAADVYAWPVIAAEHVDFFESIVANRA
jgi:glycosyltransferase involved in cell wall biosynthesis